MLPGGSYRKLASRMTCRSFLCGERGAVVARCAAGAHVPEGRQSFLPVGYYLMDGGDTRRERRPMGTSAPTMTRDSGNVRLIEVNVRDVAQLFNSMDPSPFHDKDLDREADEYIVSWAREFPIDARAALRVHLDRWPERDPTPVITEAIRNYYSHRADISDLEFRRVMREGRFSLFIGLAFLATCLTATRLLIPEGTSPWWGYLRESLTIVGWVAMWRPMETYLYDWWPIRRRTAVFRKLSAMPVEVVRTAPSQQ
jgi:hypothetical protein